MAKRGFGHLHLCLYRAVFTGLYEPLKATGPDGLRVASQRTDGDVDQLCVNKFSKPLHITYTSEFELRG